VLSRKIAEFCSMGGARSKIAFSRFYGKVNGATRRRNIGEVLISLSLAVEPVGG